MLTKQEKRDKGQQLIDNLRSLVGLYKDGFDTLVDNIESHGYIYQPALLITPQTLQKVAELDARIADLDEDTRKTMRDTLVDKAFKPVGRSTQETYDMHRNWLVVLSNAFWGIEKAGLDVPEDLQRYADVIARIQDDIDDPTSRLWSAYNTALIDTLAAVENGLLETSTEPQRGNAYVVQFPALRSLFCNSFAGIGDEVGDDYISFERVLQKDLLMGYDAKHFAGLALLLYWSKDVKPEIYRNKNGKAFGAWHKTFCEASGVPHATYRPAQLDTALQAALLSYYMLHIDHDKSKS